MSGSPGPATCKGSDVVEGLGAAFEGAGGGGLGGQGGEEAAEKLLLSTDDGIPVRL